MNANPKPTVLYLCVSNAGKSQMAEAITRQIAGDKITACSAGTHPKESVNELSARVVAEAGGDMSNARPKGIDPALLASADRVIVIGDEAQVEPVDGMRATIERWTIDEPSAHGVEGAPRMRLVRDQIASHVAHLVLELTGQPSENKARYDAVIDALAERWKDRYSRDQVRSAVREAHSELLRDAKIDSYLPVLVENRAGELLRGR